MSCIIIAEFRCKPGRAEDFIELCRANYPGTRDYDGCEYISLSVDQDDEDTLVMTEQWVSKEHHRRYSKLEKVMELLQHDFLISSQPNVTLTTYNDVSWVMMGYHFLIF